MISDFENLDVRFLKGVGERRAELFVKLGVKTVGALLRFYPRKYLDLTKCYTVAEAPVGELCAVRATVERKRTPIRISGGRTMVKIEAADETGSLILTYFNNKFTPQNIHESQSYVFFGKISGNFLIKEMTNPILIRQEEQNGLLPQYKTTEGLSNRAIQTAVKSAFEKFGEQIGETIPEDLLYRYHLQHRIDAIRGIHFPASWEEAEQAKKRLIFEELLVLQLGMSMRKTALKRTGAPKMKPVDSRKFSRELPFTLTGAQQRTINEIFSDMAGEVPMARLVLGDVGSGKTVCAAAACWLSAVNGMQSALMAPTELLASQHAATLEKMLSVFGISVALLTSSVKGKQRKLLLEKVRSGEVNLLVGTHSLIADDVEFRNLGLVIADEQHRFGVEQRSALSGKGKCPHMLVMSATPIPRTMALMIYGDLDLSLIDEMPAGRMPVNTYVVGSSLRERYLNFIIKAVNSGKQAYIVCPLVEDEDGTSDLLSAKEYYEDLREHHLQGIPMGLVHGKMTAKDKAAAMADFMSGRTSVLVSTTVIEVGMDNPNAVIMLIENAERFGLSELHQLRGRVGRGKDESYCILVSDAEGELSKKRLSTLKSTNNGFEIAKADLEIRGPGDFFGSRQHGLPEMEIADLATDQQTMYSAQEAAAEIIASDPSLTLREHAGIHDEVRRMFGQMGSAPLN